jgi:sulfur carrier protein ThiS
LTLKFILNILNSKNNEEFSMKNKKGSKMIKVKDRQKNLEYQIDGPKNVKDIINKFGFIETSILIIRGGELLTKDIVVRDGETIEILPVVSGG